LIEIIDPEELHIWYLEATKKINPENYNEKAQKPYDELNREQKFIDCHIASKINKKIRDEIKSRSDLNGEIKSKRNVYYLN